MNFLIFSTAVLLTITYCMDEGNSLPTQVSRTEIPLSTSPDPLCTGSCFVGSDGRFMAEAECRNRIGCAVSACAIRSRGPKSRIRPKSKSRPKSKNRSKSRNRRRSSTLRSTSSIRSMAGYACKPVPAAPIIQEGPLSIPAEVEFPPETIVGGTVTAEITIAVDELSSSSREDFYLLSDATGSMADQIAQVREDFSSLVQARTNASESVAFGVGYYRDERERPPFRNLQSITEDFSLASAAINLLEAQGGLDIPEANLYALSEVATSAEIGWRPSTRRILVYFGDSPGHEPTCPNGAELTREDVIEQLNREGIAVVATNFGGDRTGLNAVTVSTPGNGRFGCGNPLARTRAGQANDIAAGTQGVVARADDPRELVDIIVDAVQSLDQELSVVTNDCAGRVKVEFSPDLPLRIAAGETRTIMERVTILPGACNTPDGLLCEISIQVSGVGVRQIIQTTTIAGCTDEDGFFS